MGHYLEHQNRS